jgi:hypothetical protein
MTCLLPAQALTLNYTIISDNEKQFTHVEDVRRELAALNLEEIDGVTRQHELVLLGPVVVGGHIVGALESQLRAEQNGRSDPPK